MDDFIFIDISFSFLFYSLLCFFFFCFVHLKTRSYNFFFLSKSPSLFFVWNFNAKRFFFYLAVQFNNLHLEHNNKPFESHFISMLMDHIYIYIYIQPCIHIMKFLFLFIINPTRFSTIMRDRERVLAISKFNTRCLMLCVCMLGIRY